MLKVSWAVFGDQFSNYFAICDHKSAWQLWWTLTRLTTEGNQKPINVRVTKIDGEEIDANGGAWEYANAAELTREAS